MGKKEAKQRRETFDRILEMFANNAPLNEIELVTNEFRQWCDQVYSHASIGSFLSGEFRRKLKTIPLTADNSYTRPDLNGKSVTEHLFYKFFGYTTDDYQQRNNYLPDGKKAKSEQIFNAPEIDPDAYLQITAQLLHSHQPYQLASGLIAATGCRPLEILYTGKVAISGDYQMLFAGQLKKRGADPIFIRPVLFPAHYLVARHNFFKSLPTIASLCDWAEQQLDRGMGVEALNSALSDKRGRLIWQATTTAFDGVIAPKFGDDYVNNQALRAAFGTLVVQRDLPDSSDAARIIYFAKALGHITTEHEAQIHQQDLAKLSTTIGYGTYTVSRTANIPFMSVDIPKKPLPLLPQTISEIEAFQQKYDLASADAVFQFLLDRFTKFEQSQLAKTTKPAPEPIDFTRLSRDQLMNKPIPGIANEKIDRAVAAIMTYNNEVAPSNLERWAITIRAVQELTGSRHSAVKRYFESKKVAIDDHNQKFGFTHLQNRKPQRISDVIKW